MGGYHAMVMKKLISLTFAMVSTMFLFVGATQAAEKFDGLAQSSTPMVSAAATDLPPLPCIIPDEDFQ